MTSSEVNFDEFQYVVEQRIQDPICFGSKVPRNTTPVGKGLAPHQKRLAPEIFKAGPGYYNVENVTSTLYNLLNKVRSKKGVGFLASNDSRFKEKIFMRVPSPGRYDLVHDWGTAKQSAAPFGIKAALKTEPKRVNPGPGSYKVDRLGKCLRTKFMYNFGKPVMIEHIETFCTPNPTDTCHKCQALCTGDYWHRDKTLFLCHLCWREEKNTQEIYQVAELKKFKKLRNCTYMHSHEGTSAAIRLLPKKKLDKKRRLENYLHMYISCWARDKYK